MAESRKDSRLERELMYSRGLLARWSFVIVAVLPIGVAAGLDLLGEPPAVLHPVVWYGRLIRSMERFAPRKPRAQLWYGLGMLLMASPVACVPALLIEQLERRVARRFSQQAHGLSTVLFSVLLSGMALKPLFALGMLVKAGRLVREALEREDIVEAREALRNLVSREREQLDRELVAAAAIESLAENLSDSVVAPLFYYALFGLPGAALYRLYNTFDAMIGYHGYYEYSGKAAARLDDLLNLLPSRFTAVLIVVCAPLFAGDRYQAWWIWRRDASRTESPNAGQPMAAAAGALRLRLTKVDHYTLGDDERGISPADIKRAERMVCWVGGLALLLTAFVRFFRSEHA